MVLKAAAQFGSGNIDYHSLGEGLIHRTYKVNYSTSAESLVLQCINQQIFPDPENIINNYLLIYEHLKTIRASIQIPEPKQNFDGDFFWVDGKDNFWRATRFLANSYTANKMQSSDTAYKAAECFGRFASELSTLDPDALHTIIPGFHNLNSRYEAFLLAVSNADRVRLHKSDLLIREIQNRNYLVEFYKEVCRSNDFRLRIMHHDCKLSNVLFDRNSGLPLTPVDIDTTMPGYFFSDLGDIIRTMACTETEESIDYESIAVNKEIYQSLVAGYMEGAGKSFTSREKECIHYSGQLLIYMQAIRFLTDYLNNDLYYQTSYAGQNFNRARNQIILLQKLEEFLKEQIN